MKSKWRILGLGLFVALVSVVGLPGAVKSQSKEIIDGAKKEGKVLLYTALTIHEIDEIAGPFGKKYTFVKVESFRGNALQLLQKIAMEARAGRAQVDVAQFNGFEAWQLQKLGLLQSYKSPEARNYPEALDRDNAVWYSGLALYWGKEKADKFMRALAEQQPTMRKGHTLIATLLSSGEFPLGLVYAHRVEEMKAKGINTIEWIPLEPIVATPNVIGIGKNAPNSNAAKLFVDFFLSKEGQTISQKQQYRVPANPDLPPVSPKLDPKNLKISLVNRQIAEKYEQFDKEYQELFVKGRAE